MRHRALIAGLLLGAQGLTGCTSWRVQSITPQELVARDHPKAIQVGERGGTRYVIQTPRVEGDSLIGTVVKRVLVRGSRVRLEQRRAVSMMVVDRVAVQRINPMKTVLGVVVLPMAVFVALFAASGGMDFPGIGLGGLNLTP